MPGTKQSAVIFSFWRADLRLRVFFLPFILFVTVSSGHLSYLLIDSFTSLSSCVDYSFGLNFLRSSGFLVCFCVFLQICAFYFFRAYLSRFIPCLLVYVCLQILRHVAAIFIFFNLFIYFFFLRLSLWSVSFIFIFVSIFECSTSFVPIYFILTLCFYQHEIVSMNLDLLKRIHVLDNLIL